MKLPLQRKKQKENKQKIHIIEGVVVISAEMTQSRV